MSDARSTKSKKSSIRQEASRQGADDDDNDDENGKIFAEVDLIKKNPSFIETESSKEVDFLFCLSYLRLA